MKVYKYKSTALVFYWFIYYQWIFDLYTIDIYVRSWKNFLGEMDHEWLETVKKLWAIHKKQWNHNTSDLSSLALFSQQVKITALHHFFRACITEHGAVILMTQRTNSHKCHHLLNLRVRELCILHNTSYKADSKNPCF